MRATDNDDDPVEKCVTFLLTFHPSSDLNPCKSVVLFFGKRVFCGKTTCFAGFSIFAAKQKELRKSCHRLLDRAEKDSLKRNQKWNKLSLCLSLVAPYGVWLLEKKGVFIFSPKGLIIKSNEKYINTHTHADLRSGKPHNKGGAPSVMDSISGPKIKRKEKKGETNERLALWPLWRSQWSNYLLDAKKKGQGKGRRGDVNEGLCTCFPLFLCEDDNRDNAPHSKFPPKSRPKRGCKWVLIIVGFCEMSRRASRQASFNAGSLQRVTPVGGFGTCGNAGSME